MQMHCPACAVVSSSGHLLGAGGGQKIDQASCVFRMNAAPTKGYERDVGSCTHVRVISHTSIPILMRQEWEFFSNGINVTYVVWGPVQHLRRNKGGSGEPAGVTYQALKELVGRHPGLSVYTLTEQEMKESNRTFLVETGKDRLKSGSYLSTGWFTLILALRMCDHIVVYGMVDPEYCRSTALSLGRWRFDHRPWSSRSKVFTICRTPTSKVPYHYFEPAGVTECATYRLHEVASRGAHRFITEKAVFGRWALHANTVIHRNKGNAHFPSVKGWGLKADGSPGAPNALAPAQKLVVKRWLHKGPVGVALISLEDPWISWCAEGHVVSVT
uniref:alpha-N-acetyl-neuraminyl-2,3-beta-galactosyl-1, 3-N-acetyl-galactosaminide alpha-2,6-sialyltransferase-like n=1 Tax=Myxine glutinosa TaxID=7769 RepID=UPI00358EEB53